MRICGLQKLTLLDFPERVACTVFLGGCDFRCPFCHNAGLLENPEPLMTEGELLRFLEKRCSLLDGVVITGGEPLLQRDLPDLLRKIKAMGYPIKIDTNGTHPNVLQAIIDEGLADYVAMDIKNSPARYAQTVGKEAFDLSPIQKSIGILLSGTVDYEFRTTCVGEFHNDDSFREIAKWIFGAKRYYLQQFEDHGSVLGAGLHAPSTEDMRRWLEIVAPSVRFSALRGVL